MAYSRPPPTQIALCRKPLRATAVHSTVPFARSMTTRFWLDETAPLPALVGSSALVPAIRYSPATVTKSQLGGSFALGGTGRRYSPRRSPVEGLSSTTDGP